MRCPECGAWSEVEESRKAPQDMIRRRRLCANEHRFTTFEVLPQVVKAAGKNVSATERAVNAARQRWARDQSIKRDKRTIPTIAREHGVSVERVRQIKRASAEPRS